MNFLLNKITGTRQTGYAPLPTCSTEMSLVDDSPDILDPSSREYATLKEKTIGIIAAIPTPYLSADKGRAAIEALRAGRLVSLFLSHFSFFSLSWRTFYVLSPSFGRCRQSHGGAPAEDPDGRPSTTRSGPRPWPIEKTLSPDGSRTSLFADRASSACRPRFVSFGEKKEILGQHMDESPFFVLLYSVVSKGQRGRGNLFLKTKKRGRRRRDGSRGGGVARSPVPATGASTPQRPTGAA